MGFAAVISPTKDEAIAASLAFGLQPAVHHLNSLIRVFPKDHVFSELNEHAKAVSANAELLRKGVQQAAGVFTYWIPGSMYTFFQRPSIVDIVGIPEIFWFLSHAAVIKYEKWNEYVETAHFDPLTHSGFINVRDRTNPSGCLHIVNLQTKKIVDTFTTLTSPEKAMSVMPVTVKTSAVSHDEPTHQCCICGYKHSPR